MLTFTNDRHFLLFKGSKGPLVRLLQQLLNQAVTPKPILTVDGSFGPQTEKAVKTFAQSNNIQYRHITCVSYQIWKLLGRKLGWRAILFNGDIPFALRTIMLQQPGLRLGGGRDRDSVFAAYPHLFPRSPMTDHKRQGFANVLGFIENDTLVTDVRWQAYMLATVALECSHQWHPIREGGCNDATHPVCSPIVQNGRANRRSYGDHQPCPNSQLKPPKPCPAGKQTHTYYGRGYVQITHKDNYQAIGRRIGRGDELMHNPELALDPTVAYAIMSVGMREGTFTGSNLAQFINDNACDYKNARKIINPADSATYEPIANAAERFEDLLRITAL